MPSILLYSDFIASRKGLLSTSLGEVSGTKKEVKGARGLGDSVCPVGTRELGSLCGALSKRFFGNSTWDMSSKLSCDLFDTPSCKAALTSRTRTSREKARQHANEFACPTDDDKIIACLSRVNSTQLGITAHSLPSARSPATLTVTDGYLLENDPRKLLWNGKLRFLMLSLAQRRT